MALKTFNEKEYLEKLEKIRTGQYLKFNSVADLRKHIENTSNKHF